MLAFVRGLASVAKVVGAILIIVFVAVAGVRPAAAQAIVFTPTSLPNGTTGISYTQIVAATDSDSDDTTAVNDGDDTFTYTVSAGALPPGLTLTLSGIISGTPNTGGTYSFTVMATDASSNIGAQGYTINIGTNNSLTLNPTTLPNATQGTPYNQTVTASGGTGPYTYSVAAGSLPAGLSLNPSTGAITGIPTGSGSSSFTIQALDSVGNTGSQPYTVNVGTVSLTVNPATLPAGTQGVPYNQTVNASGGTAPYTFSVASGSLPAALSLDPISGAITGTPTTPGQSLFTIQAVDSSGNTGSRSYAVNIGGSAALTVSPPSLPNGTQGTAYSQTVTASGGTGPYTYSVAGGALPAGLSLNPNTGAIAGIPTGSGSSSFTIRALDTVGNTGTQAYTVNVGTVSLTVNPATLPAGTQGTPYSQTVSASGGTGPYTYSVAAGSLPAGLSLNPSTGAITGIPTGSGSSSFTIQALDSVGNIGTQAYTVNIGTVSLTVNPATLPAGTQGVPYNQTVNASGGTAPYTFSVASGSLPAALSLDANSGAITGTPTTPGQSLFTIQAVDSVGNTGSRSYAVNIGGTGVLTLAPPSLPNGTQGTAYFQAVSASGGTAPYGFAVIAGALPAGLTLSAGGVISGTPTGSGLASFTIQAIDLVGNLGSQAYTVNIGNNSLTVNPATLPAGTQGVPYSQTVSVIGGTGPYTFSVSSGALPPGLALDPNTGAITGTPTTLGQAIFTIQVADSSGNTGSRSYAVNTGGIAVLTVSPPSLPNGTQGTAYSQTVSASGGTGPYTFALTAGALPAGLTLSSAGVISGTPTGSGPSSFTVGATDSVGNTGSQAYSVNIGTVSLTVNPASLPNGTQGTAYSQTVSATGGTGPYTFLIAAGALPAGLTLSSAGVISGTPTGSGASAFTVLAVDSLGNAGTRAYSINIGTVSLTVNPASLPATVVGHSYSQTVSATGGTAPYSFTIAAGALPPGLTLNAATGVISGTPSRPGTASFTVQAVDSLGNIGTRAYTLSNRPDPALDPEVQGLITAQVTTAQRFASAQVDNIARHLESLHDHFNPCAFNFGMTPPLDPAGQQYGAPYGYPAYGNTPYGYTPYGPAPYGGAGVGVPPGYGPPPQGMRGPSDARECATDWASSLALWTAGSFQLGSMTPSSTASSNRFTTAGLTAGLDIRAADNLIVGLALGYGADRSDIGQNGTRSDAASYSATLYASLRLFDPVFVDTAVGYGTLGYDNRRWVSGDGATVQGTRSGSYWFGALEASLEMRSDQFKFAPYARTNFISATLNGYAEGGPSAQLLTYDALKFNAVSGALGLRGSIDIPMSFGVFTPTARFEYKQTSQSAFDQSMYYSDLGAATSSTFSQPAGVYGMTTGAIGFRVRAAGGLAADVEYGVTGGTGSLRAQALRATVRVPF